MGVKSAAVDAAPAAQGACLLGRYVMLEEQPCIGPGHLFRGRDQRTGESLRIRAIPTSRLPADRIEMLERDAEHLRDLRKPSYFPRVRDVIEDGGFHYLIQEGRNGLSLADYCEAADDGLLGRHQIVHLFRQIADRMAYLHNHIRGAFLFRGLTLDHIAVDPDTRTVRLVDFSFASIAAGPPSGKPDTGVRQHLAPELYREEPASIYSEIYALGRVLQFLVFGETDEDPTPATPIPRAVGRGIPDQVRELVQRMVAPDPSLRPRNVESVKKAFETCFEGTASSFVPQGNDQLRALCRSCATVLDKNNILCSHCGTAVPHKAKKGSERREPTVFVSPLDAERFIGLRPISLERYELMQLSAAVARSGGYDHLLAAEEERHDQPLAELVQLTRDLRGRAVVIGPDPLRIDALTSILLAEYHARGWVKRALVLAPGNLASGWHRRLTTGYGLDATLLNGDGSGLRKKKKEALVIATPESFQSRTEIKTVTDQPWDIVIVDAAHLFTVKGSHRARLLAMLRSKYMILATASPVQDSPSDLLTLLQIARPDLWNLSVREFRASVETRQPALRAKLDRSLMHMREPRVNQSVEASYRLATPEGTVKDLYSAIVESVSSNDLDVQTVIKLQQALVSASPTLLDEAASDPAVSTVVTGVRTLLDAERHPKIRHLIEHVLPELPKKSILIASDPKLVDVLAEQCRMNKIHAIAMTDPKRAPKVAQQFASDDDLQLLLMDDAAPNLLPRDLVEAAVLFDLPWEPSCVAERVARISGAAKRGQPVKLLQLLAPDTVEEWLFDLYQDQLQLFRPASPMFHAFQATLDERETFDVMIGHVAVEGIKGGQRTTSAKNIERRIAGIRDHVEASLQKSSAFLSYIAPGHDE